VPDLVRVKINGFEKNVGADFAKNKELEVLKDEPTHRPDGQLRATTRTGGRRVKKKTTVAKTAAEKKAASSEPAKTAEEASK
jgi:hypothetical protein